MVIEDWLEPAIDLRLRPPLGAFLRSHLYDPESGLPRRLGDRGYTIPPSFGERSIEALFGEMSRARIGSALVPARAPSRLGSVPNADAAAIVSQQPDRFAGFVASISTNSTAAALADIEEAVGLSAVALGIEPGLAEPERHADDPALSPIYEAIEATTLPLFVTGGDAGPDTTYASPVAIERASARFPRIQFVAVHGGWPYVGEMLAVALRRPNVWVMPDLYFARFLGHADYVEAANGILRDRMLFATSYPAVNLEEYVGALFGDGLSAEAWRAIGVDNPARLFAGRLPSGPMTAVRSREA